MIGTVANTLAIIIGSLVGGTVGDKLGSKYKDILFTALGLACLGIGLNASVSGMAQSVYPVLFIASMAIGGVVGTALDLDGRFNRAVNSRSKGENDLGRGLSTAIMLFCIGTLSILGPINAALYGDHTYLFTNAMLDLITSMALASTFGMGIVIAAAVLFLWQGGIYLGATFLAPLLSGGLMAEIQIVGGLLIVASGLSLLKLKEIPTMNLLPALFVPPIWFAIIFALGLH